MIYIKLVVTSSIVFLAGCTGVSTSYQRPDLPKGPVWPTSISAESAEASGDSWWIEFGDPNLTALVEDVVARNNDILAAALRARTADLQAKLAANALFPKLNGNLAVSQTKPLDGIAASTKSSSTSLSVSYEADLWGRLAAQRDNAKLEAHATTEDYEAARLVTIGMTIETYFRIAHANQSIALAESSLDYVQQIQTLVRKQVEIGYVSDLELREIEQTVETQIVRLSEMRQARLVLRNVLIVLLNGESNPASEPKNLSQYKLPIIAAGLPAELLARRPDLRAAEARLRATLRGADATRAGFYPAISLTGGLGTSSEKLHSFVANPIATIGAETALAFLNLKDMDLTIAVSQAQYEEAVAAFRRVLLDAFADVANALEARTSYAEQERHLSNAYAAAQEAERLNAARYRAGAITLRTWLDSQERSRVAENALADIRLMQFVNESILFRALGGGTQSL